MKINSRLEIFQTLWGNLKVFIHSILRKHMESGSCKAKKRPGMPWKTAAREHRQIGKESKNDRFARATAISKRANANLGIKISRPIISRRLNEINLNSRVVSTKSYLSKKNKVSRLKFATEHVIWTEEKWDCVHFSDESTFNQFNCDDISISALKSALHLKEEE